MKVTWIMVIAHAVLLLALVEDPAWAEPANKPSDGENTVLPSTPPEQPGQAATPSASPFAQAPAPVAPSPPSARSPRFSRQGILRGRLRSKVQSLFHRGNP